MQRWGSKLRRWVKRRKTLCLLQLSLPAQISNSMYRNTNVKLADMHFINGNAPGNGSHLIQVQQLSSLPKDHHLLCIILVLPLYEFCDVFPCLYHASKHKIIHSLVTSIKALKCLEIQLFATLELLYVNLWSTVLFLCASPYRNCVLAGSTLV